MTGAMDKIKAKVDNVLHKDKDTTHDATGTHTTGTTHNDPTGPHGSHAANKADPRVDSDHVGTVGNTAGAGGVGAGQYGTTGTHGTTHGTTGSGLTGSHTTHGSDPTGPHDSRLANKADPRVDSDRVGPAGNSASAGGVGSGIGNETHTSGAGLTHSSHGHIDNSGLAGSNTHRGSDPTGPHDSRLANKADPRVDSDRYGAAGNTAGAGGVGAGQYGTHTGSGVTGTHGTHTGSGLTGTHGTHGSTGYSDPSGPHDSRLGNKADPRVDSDRYGAAGNTAGAGGVGAGQYGTTGTHTGSGLTGSHGTHGSTGAGLTGTHGTHGSSGYTDPSGPHDSRLGNKADPRVDSDRYGGQGNTYGTAQGSGLTGNNNPSHVGNPNANKTAGPHGSDLLNKLDPRVDSDLDGSKTTGGDRTYG